MKAFVKILLIALIPSTLVAGEIQYENISITIPDGWAINSSIIENKKGEKIGEFVPTSASAHIKSGTDFIQYVKNGLEYDTDFIESGSHENVYWVCSSNIAYGDSDGPVTWFPRTFWSNGRIVILYSRVSCKENFEQAIKIAKSIRTK